MMGWPNGRGPQPPRLDGVTAGTSTDFPPIGPGDVTAMVIRSGTAAIEVDSLERAVAQVRALAARIGAYVAGTEVQTGREQVPSASLELKIPAARFDEALAGLRPIGKVERVDVNAEDVGEEFVDVTARMENARRLEQRLVTLLAARTGKLSDVLAVERELARVREEIERYEGRLRYLRTHAATSTLAVQVHQPYPQRVRASVAQLRGGDGAAHPVPGCGGAAGRAGRAGMGRGKIVWPYGPYGRIAVRLAVALLTGGG